MSVKTAVIKPLLQKASLDPKVPATTWYYRPVSNLPFL